MVLRRTPETSRYSLVLLYAAHSYSNRPSSLSRFHLIRCDDWFGLEPASLLRSPPSALALSRARERKIACRRTILSVTLFNPATSSTLPLPLYIPIVDVGRLIHFRTGSISTLAIC